MPGQQACPPLSEHSSVLAVFLTAEAEVAGDTGVIKLLETLSLKASQVSWRSRKVVVKSPGKMASQPGGDREEQRHQ